MMEKEQNVPAITLEGHFVEIEVCRRNVRSSSRLHSRISRSEASFAFFITSARKLVVEPPMTVDLSLIVAAVTLGLAD